MRAVYLSFSDHADIRSIQIRCGCCNDAVYTDFCSLFLGGIRFPLINKILGLMPDQLLQMNMVVSYFNLYSIAGRIMGAAGIILVVYSVMTVMICPLLYRIYRKAQVK